MRKKVVAFLLTIMASINVMMAQVPQVPQNDTLEVVIMSDKVENPIGEHGGTPKSPSQSLYVYRYGNILDFGTNLTGCPVMLNRDDEVAYSTIVGMDGTVVLPAGLFGTYELQITVGIVVYVAELTFADD